MSKRITKNNLTMPLSIEKVPTFINGFDQVIEGGLPKGRTTVINGGPGSGKTLLGLEFLYRGALSGEPGIFIGFEESVEQLRQNAATMGWDLYSLEKQNSLFIFDGSIKPDTLETGKFSLKGLLAAISGKSKELGAKRITIDALEVVLRLFDSPNQVRNEMHNLNFWLQKSGLSAILTTRPGRESISAFEEFFDSMGDCVINLDARISGQVTTRRLRIVKYRGSSFGRNEYPYSITGKGFFVAPISTVGLRHKPLGDKIPTGVARLSDILGGGYRRGACILIAGMPGTGKTLMASSFADAICKKGESVLYIGFEESEDAMVANVLSAGVSVKKHIDSGRLRFLTNYPEAMGVEEHYIRALEQIDSSGAKHVIVDAISACYRMGGNQASFEYLMRLLNLCKEKGLTTLFLNQLSGTNSYLEISGNEISSMIDTAILLTYKFNPGETNRILEVLKSRGSYHSNQKWEYLITDDGIRILDRYTGEGDVLTGSARKVQEEKDRQEDMRLKFEIQVKELELKRLQLIQKQMTESRLTRKELHNIDKPVNKSDSKLKKKAGKL